MSVILDALRQKNKTVEVTEGFFWPKSQSSSRFSFPALALAFGLLAFAGVSAAGIYYWIQSRPVSKAIPKSMPKVVAKAIVAAPALAPVAVRNYEVEAQKAFERSNFVASIDLFKQALVKSPQSWILLNNLALALGATGKLDEAESYFFKAISANVHCASCYNNLGDLEVKRGSMDQAELYYQKATVTDPKYADPYFNLGVLQEKSGDIEAASYSYNNFLERSENKKLPLYKKVEKHLKELQKEIQVEE